MEFILAACRLQLVEREKFRELMEISLDKQQKVFEVEKKKREGGKVTTNFRRSLHDLDNSLAEKTWQDMDIALGNVNQPSVKSESAVDEIKEEIKVEIKTEIESEENFECGKCGKYSPSGISLGIHMRNVHNESRVIEKRKQMFSCKFCTKSYPLKHQMVMHMKKQHTKPPENTKTSKVKRENGQKPDNDETSETDEIQKCLMELSEDEDDNVEAKNEQNSKKQIMMNIETKTVPDKQNSKKKTKMNMETNVVQDELNSKQILMDVEAKDRLNSEQIMMDVDKLISASNPFKSKGDNAKQLLSCKEDKDISHRTKKDTVEHLLTQLRESKYFRSQKNQVFFECPPKEADTFVPLDLIPGWRSKMSKVKSLAIFGQKSSSF